MKIKFMGLAFLNAAIVCGAQVNQGGHMNAYEKNTVFGCGTFPSDVPFVHMATQSYLKTKMIIKEDQSGTGFFPRCQYFPDDFFGINVQNNSDVCMDPWVLDEEDCSEGQESDNNKSYSASPKSYLEVSKTDDSHDTIMKDASSLSLSADPEERSDEISEQGIPTGSSTSAVIMEEKLSPTRAGVFDPLVRCAFEGKGAKAPLWVAERSTYRISITNLTKLLECIETKCPKRKPTKDTGSRIKTLRNMFTDWPIGSLRKEAFDVHVKKCPNTKNVGSARLSLLLREYQSVRGE